MKKNPYFLFSLIFFLSGSASLIYQVIWMKEMSLFFGSDIYASAITLAAFMSGLSLGAFIAGSFTDKIKRHLLLYGILEISIGLYALFFHPILDTFDPLLRSFYGHYHDNAPAMYHMARFSIAFMLLLVPTTFMGATLPVILKAFTDKKGGLGKTTSHFYAINTFGALAGVFVSGFILMPHFGVVHSNYVAVGLNMLLGLTCVTFFSAPKTEGPEKTQVQETQNSDDAGDSIKKNTALVAIAVSGFCGLGLEVIWTRILIQSFSATVYSFSMMLVAFLFGIAAGSKMTESRLDPSANALKMLAKIQLLAGFSVAVLACLMFLIPFLFGTLVWGLSAISPGWFGFASVFGALLVSSVFIMPSTVLLGASFPAAMKAYNNDLKSTGRDSGLVLFVNTLGSVAGALITGLVLIPAVGSLNALSLFSVIFLFNGAYIYGKTTGSNFRKLAFPAGITFLCLLAAAYMPRQVVLNYNIQQNRQPTVLHHSEDVTGYIDVIRNQKNETILSINGNIEADNSLTQLRHFILKAHLPLMFIEHPKHVLVVGLGLGITTSSIFRHWDVERVDVIELSPGVVKAQQHLKDVNQDVLSDPRLVLKIDDGRNYLKFTRKKYDLITADPIHPRISGVGVLYTEEYYRLIRERLNPNGVVLQWMPVYSISKESFETAVRTMANIFPNTSVWYVPGHTLLLGMRAENAPLPDFQIFRRKFAEPEILTDLNRIGINEITDLLKLQILSSNELKKWLEDRQSSKINTENLTYLEYQTPFEFLHQPAEILDSLSGYWGNDFMRMVNSPAGLAEALKFQAADYRASITAKREK
jgi:spermidine synthase